MLRGRACREIIDRAEMDNDHPLYQHESRLELRKWYPREDWCVYLKFLRRSKTNSHRIDVWGTLTFKQVNDIAKGLFIDYQNDRIVFTETKEWSLDYRAFVSNYPYSQQMLTTS